LGFVEESAARIPKISPLNQPGGPQFCAVWAGDLDGDNDNDLYFSNYAGGGGTSDAMLFNNGSGFFTDVTTSTLGNLANVAFGTSVEFHDVDRDGDLDIIKTSTLYSFAPFGRGIYILYNDGNGRFNLHPIQALFEGDPYMFAGGMLDQDDFTDFYIVNDSQDQVVKITAVEPNGPVTLTPAFLSNSPRTSGFGGNIKFADLDGDGFRDVGVAPIDVDIANCGAPVEFALLRNDQGVLSDPYILDENIHVDPHDFAFLNINNDDCPDIFMGLCTGFRIFINSCPPLCPADCEPPGGNQLVDQQDLMTAVAAWPSAGAGCDLAPDKGLGSPGDGRVAVDDLLAIIAAFGPCPTP